MSEKRFEFYSDEDLVGVLDIVTGRTFNSFEIVDVLNEQQAIIRRDETSIKTMMSNMKKLEEENEQLRNELTFLNKVISFFADNPMTKYSSKSELLEEMKLLEEMGLI